MRVLLDTHALLWALVSPEKLSRVARDILREPTNVRLVSAVSAYEISYKFRLGKLDIEPSLTTNYLDHLHRFLATELPVSSQHSLLAGNFPWPHRDPFDRLLAAQSLLEGIPLLSADRAFDGIGIQLLW